MARRRFRIVWTTLALDDLREIREFVSRDDPGAARRLASRIRKGVLRLGIYPLSGRIVPELASQEFREVIVAPYRIVYEVRSGEIVVLRVWHGRRHLGGHEYEMERED